MSTPDPVTGRLCPSTIHEEPVPAVVLGTFDIRHVNGREPRPDSAYCLKCAAMLHDLCYFTPDDPEDAPRLAEHFTFLTTEKVTPGRSDR